MKCPICTTTDLLMAERQGIEIDYCPQCRGVWLDRGELDKIVERSQAVAVEPNRVPGSSAVPMYSHESKHGHGHGHEQEQKHGYAQSGYQHKKSIWNELFD